ncbi:hypothetical protein NU08_1365 [Flavobacterium anhuiense]|uniref:Uncharacterized protein n=1 Tax=Flavobacterium anhuiense TaxID=459526 RepID=A0A444W1W2_9FLAO|nr:hypothetical protein NU08_1365 [Flavobacterium anhuiense]
MQTLVRKKYKEKFIINNSQFRIIRSYFQLSTPSPHKKSKVSNVIKKLPLVAFLKQETFAFFTPGFPLQSGLGII